MRCKVKRWMIMSNRSSTCFKRNGDALMEYVTLYEAEDSARFVLAKFNNEMTPYFCGTCDKYHLVLKGKVPNSGYSSCTDSKGWPKDSYETEEAAERQAKHLFHTRQIVLHSYSCFNCNYWHLTSN